MIILASLTLILYSSNMPELPEVHTTVTGLQKVLPRLTITEIWCDMWSTSLVAKNTIKDKNYFSYFKKHTLNQKIKNVVRRAKYILINLENDFTIIVHLKMTGHLLYGKYEKNKNYNGKEWAWLPIDKNKSLHDKYNRHIRVVFTFSNNKHLVFCDSRKFGTMIVIKTENVYKEKLAHLGPEPLDKNFKLKDFKTTLFKSSTRAIKTVLMDQSIISGIGNIYSDEILHRVHILPTRTTKSLTEIEWRLLFKEMQNVLKKGIEFGGDSMSDYRNVTGAKGNFQEKHLVYLRTGEKCKTKNCKGIIKKQKIGGRSAHYCPVCQK